MAAQQILCTTPLLVAYSAAHGNTRGQSVGTVLTRYLALSPAASADVGALFNDSQSVSTQDRLVGLVLALLFATAIAATQQRWFELVWTQPRAGVLGSPPQRGRQPPPEAGYRARHERLRELLRLSRHLPGHRSRLSPDGAHLVVTVSGLNSDGNKFVNAIWAIDRSGGEPARRLTYSENGESGPVFAADGSLLFLATARPTTTNPRRCGCCPPEPARPARCSPAPAG